MSLTLNVSKEAKLFYQSEQKIREYREGDTIQPSSTIHMKKYAPEKVRYSDLLRSENVYRSDDGTSSDEYLEDTQDRRDWISQFGKSEFRPIKRRRLLAKDAPQLRNLRTSSHDLESISPPSKYSYSIKGRYDKDDPSFRQKRDKSKHVEKLRRNESNLQQEVKQKHEERKGHSLDDDMISRDLHGDNNSDDMQEEDSTNTILPAQNARWRDDELLKIDENESRNISENNPFAKQRMLKSKYKSLYSN